MALLIALVGVAGVLAFSVSGRTREFGIRLALGAQPRSILKKVLLEGLVLAGIGLVLDAALGGVGLIVQQALNKYAVGRYLAQIQLPGVVPLLASAVVILAAALIASALPAARAARVNAVEALRSE